jgi:hypothetical protein
MSWPHVRLAGPLAELKMITQGQHYVLRKLAVITDRRALLHAGPARQVAYAQSHG